MNTILSQLNFGFKRQVPVINQSELAECGLASIAMIAGFYGYESDLTTFRAKFSVSSHGATLEQLMHICDQLNLSCRPLKLDMDGLPELQLPCVLHWELCHFVVLTKVTDKYILINDPAVGERKIPISQAEDLFSGVALEVSPTSEFKPQKDVARLSLSDFWSNITGLKRNLSILFALSLLLQLFALAAPFYLQTVVDDIIVSSDNELLLVLAVGFGLLLVINVFTSWLRDIVILHLSNKMNVQMAANVFHHLIRLPLGYFSKRYMGDLVSRFQSLEKVREILTTQIVSAVVDGLLAILTLVAMFIYSPLLASIVLGVSLFYLALRLIFYRPLQLLTKEQIISFAKEDSHFMESLYAIQTVKVFQKETERQAQWQTKFTDSINKGIQISRWQIRFDTTNKFLFGLENVIVIYLAAIAVMDNIMSLGMLYAFLSYKGRYTDSVNDLIKKCIEFKMLEIHLNRLADIVLTEKEQQPDSSFAPLRITSSSDVNHPLGDIEVKGLSYHFSSTDPAVFENVNLTIKQGETVAIVGPSGCGKTTLMKCIMGLLSPSAGEIRVGGIELMNEPSYRKSIAGVMQDEQMLAGTIVDNITMFSANPDYEKLAKCTEMACINDEVNKMVMGYNTLVGDMGGSLSGGQKQRIFLARALYSDPDVLFLDEATSHLDISNEKRVNQYVSSMNITRVIVAHRPETIQSADRILHMQDIVKVKE